jgi:hypothetical protein
MKQENPIEEIWRIRDELAAAEGYDVDKLFEPLRREERKYGDRVVHNLKQQRAAEDSGAVLREKPPKPE